jgi:hypothetical protein
MVPVESRATGVWAALANLPLLLSSLLAAAARSIGLDKM